MNQPEREFRPNAKKNPYGLPGRSNSGWLLVLSIAVYAVFFAFLLVTAISVGI